MAREPSQKLVDYGIIAGILFGAYTVWSFVFKQEKRECPLGQHAVNPCEGVIGWPKFLCDLGRNITGAALDCKPDISLPVTCEPGYKLENGVCVAIGPGGCPVMAETCNNIYPAGSHFLNEATCMCEAKKYTDECVLGTNDCKSIPIDTAGHWGFRVLECIFISPFGNRWQVHPDMIPCGVDAITPPSPEQLCIESCNYAPTQHAKENCQADCRGLPWPWPVIPSVPASNIVDCPCGKIDLNNPPGTTCESACVGWPLIPVPTPGIVCVPGMANILAMGHRMGGSMQESACIAMGGKIREGGRCENDAEYAYQEYIRACGSCGSC